MPVRTVFRDPSTGRFISRAVAEELGEAIQMTISDGDVVEAPITFDFGGSGDEESSAEPYDVEPSKWGGRMFDGDDGLDEDRLDATEFPDGYDRFRVTYQVGDTSRYAKGYASTEWFGADQWPPSLDMLENVSPDGIGHIIFRRSQ